MHVSLASVALLLVPAVDGFTTTTTPTSSSSDVVTRAQFTSAFVAGALSTLFIPQANAFDGGVGGLGKTRPQTGVVFRDPEDASSSATASGDDVTYELLAPDGTPTFLTFSAPWYAPRRVRLSNYISMH